MGDKSPRSKQKNKVQKLKRENSKAREKSDLIGSKQISNTITPPKKTPKPSAKKTPKPSAKKTPKPSAKKTPKPSAKKTPKPSAKKTPKPSAKKKEQS